MDSILSNPNPALLSNQLLAVVSAGAFRFTRIAPITAPPGQLIFASKCFSRRVPILPRPKVFEASADGCLKNVKFQVFRERQSFLLGHQFSSAGMAQGAKEV
jgi:hypothetical protein